MEPETTIEKAERLLDGIDDLLPVRVDYITPASEENWAIAVVRRSDGYLFIGPHPESESALYGSRAVLDFIGEAPELVRELLEIAKARSEEG